MSPLLLAESTMEDLELDVNLPTLPIFIQLNVKLESSDDNGQSWKETSRWVKLFRSRALKLRDLLQSHFLFRVCLSVRP